MVKLFTRFIRFVAARMSAYHFPFVGKPFRGDFAYEIQVGPSVWMWKHEEAYYDFSRIRIRRLRLSYGKFVLWYDTAWFFMVTRPIRRLLRRLRNG